MTELNQWDTVKQHLGSQVRKTASRRHIYVTYPVPTTIRKVVKVEDNHIVPKDALPRLEFVKPQPSQYLLSTDSS